MMKRYNSLAERTVECFHGFESGSDDKYCCFAFNVIKNEKMKSTM